MSALRSALLDVLRGLPDAELARIVRAAPDDVLRPLVQIGLNLESDDHEEAEAEEAAPPRRRAAAKPKKVTAPREDGRGTRPSQASQVEAFVAALSKGPKGTSELKEILGVNSDRVRVYSQQAGKRVRKVSGGKGQGEAVWEATGK